MGKPQDTGIIGMDAESRPSTVARLPVRLAGFKFAILLAAALSVSMAYGVTLPILPFVVERILGGGNSRAIAWHTGMLTGIYTFALFFLSPVWGALSDRADRRVIIVVGLIGSSLSLFVLDQANSLPALYLARGLSGATSAAVLPAVLAYVAEGSAASERPRKFAITASATTVGFLLGPVIGSWLSSMILAPVVGMRIAGILMADSPFFAVGTAGLFFAAALYFLPAIAIYRQNSLVANGTRNKPVNQRAIYVGLLLTCITVFGITVAEVGITLFGKQVLLLDPSGITRFFLVCSGVMIVVQLGLFPFFMRMLSMRTLLIIAFLMIAIGLALIPYAPTTLTSKLFFSLVSMGTAILIPALATVISEAAGLEQGKAMGQQASAANLGQALAASTTGALFLVTPSTPFLVGAAVVIAGFLIALRRTAPNALSNCSGEVRPPI